MFPAAKFSIRDAWSLLCDRLGVKDDMAPKDYVRFLALGVFVIITNGGCNWLSGEESAEDDLLSFADALTEGDQKSENAGPTKLTLNLNEGDRFPLIKTVQQEVSQTSLQGVSKSTSEVELYFAITVEEIRDDQKRLGVTYSRVKYSHNLEGETVRYDSNKPTGSIPQAALPYHGMVNNGFSFWIGPDNQIIDIVNFNDFLQNCLRDVPHDQRDNLMQTLLASSSQDGIANFVDDSIALLPYDATSPDKGSTVSVGDHWQRERTVPQPLPMKVSHTYTLKSVNDSVAEIDVIGTISPTAATTADASGQQAVQVAVRDGNMYGTCKIDVATGLPIQSQIDQYINMNVTMKGGISFDQRKRTLTTVRAFPQQVLDGTETASSSADTNLQ